jgi:nucleoside recognition membrane protein YjiH
MFGVYYLVICLVGVVCAVICPRIPPLSRKRDEYLVEGRAMPDTLPEGYNNSREYGLALALSRAAKHRGAGEFFANGTKNCLSMWFGVLPTVMAIGTLALIVANYTPLFTWLGMPFYPLLSALGVPEAAAAAGTMVVGFTDMFTPAILISACADPMTRFIVAVISVTQVLFLDEVGGLILGSKLPVGLGELFVIFLERTIISILIVVPLAHLLF